MVIGMASNGGQELSTLAKAPGSGHYRHPFPIGSSHGALLIPGEELLNRHAEDKAGVYTNGDIHV